MLLTKFIGLCHALIDCLWPAEENTAEEEIFRAQRTDPWLVETINLSETNRAGDASLGPIIGIQRPRLASIVFGVCCAFSCSSIALASQETDKVGINEPMKISYLKMFNYCMKYFIHAIHWAFYTGFMSMIIVAMQAFIRWGLNQLNSWHYYAFEELYDAVVTHIENPDSKSIQLTHRLSH
ncbi:MAG: hypothetical protein AAF304_10460 [Pseudomonadota bacterium]